MNKKGFTLIELLIVVVVIGILAGIVLVAINPARQIAQANNSQRQSDINAILNATHQYSIDNRGSLPSAITATATDVGTGAGLVNLTTDLVPTYIAAMPYDPVSGADADTNYAISVDANGRVTVTAHDAELSETISVTR